MPQNIKLTDNKEDRLDQRQRTQQVKDLNKNFDELDTTPPSFITNENTRALYTYLATQLNQSGYINNTDSSILISLVINIQAMQSAYKSLEELGAIYETQQLMKQNPAVNIITATTAKIISASKQLGFSPQARASLINLAQVDKEDSAKKIMSLLADE
ncbi:hypothetical protein LCIT_17090 [Leuconostoc citreum]|uniref:Phage terminase small subunit P27 family n=1 Tax=Leuconostoc citreum TaxID=33964 RepID=A0A5A5U0J1_LEUCI|nr:phage terminase small subunit P27 family [Leuconostoc citreum]GDZ84467.1 hypothetical protein LCIT_17090 [Leuconostoc citreum]